jgi:hypothetical protein
MTTTIGERTLSTYDEIMALEAKLAAAFQRLDQDERAAACERDDAGAAIIVDFGWFEAEAS